MHFSKQTLCALLAALASLETTHAAVLASSEGQPGTSTSTRTNPPPILAAADPILPIFPLTTSLPTRPIDCIDTIERDIYTPPVGFQAAQRAWLQHILDIGIIPPEQFPPLPSEYRKWYDGKHWAPGEFMTPEEYADGYWPGEANTMAKALAIARWMVKAAWEADKGRWEYRMKEAGREGNGKGKAEREEEKGRIRGVMRESKAWFEKATAVLDVQDRVWAQGRWVVEDSKKCGVQVDRDFDAWPIPRVDGKRCQGHPKGYPKGDKESEE